MDEYDDDYDDQVAPIGTGIYAGRSMPSFSYPHVSLTPQWEEGDGEGIGFAMSKDSARERDFESIRRFNALLKKKEAEEAYWKDLAIQQEQLGEGEGEGEDEEGEVKQGAEPDGPGAAAPAQAAAGGFGARGGRGGGGGRGRGGGEGRGGSGGRGGADGGGDDMSARAKRRKEQQKSRIGNHNRKARANAKQSRGLGGPPVG